MLIYVKDRIEKLKIMFFKKIGASPILNLPCVFYGGDAIANNRPAKHGVLPDRQRGRNTRVKITRVEFGS